MKIHETFSEDLVVDGTTYIVDGLNRDWNPLEGIEPPPGTVWEAHVEVDGHILPGAGQSKFEAIKNLRRLIRSHNSFGHLMNTNGLKDALERAHADVEERIELWHNGETENGLIEFLGWSKQEYTAYVEDNVLPTKEIERFMS